MGRSLGVVLLSLVVGAGVMYAASHFRFRVEPVGEAPAAKPAPEPPVTVRYGEPEKLPERITRNDRDGRPDPAVRQAAAAEGEREAAVAGNAADAAVPVPPIVEPRIVAVREDLDGRPVIWDAATNREVRLVGRGGSKVVLYLAEKPNAARLAVFVNRALFGTSDPAVGGIEVKDAETPPQVVVTLKDVPPGTVLRIGLAGDKTKALAPTTDVVLIAPGPKDGADVRALVTDSLDSPYLSPFAPVTGSVTVLNGYLRLRGRALGGAPEFFLLTGDGPAPTVIPLPRAEQKSFNPSTGDWEYELDLGPKPNGTQGHVLVRTAAVGEGHFYAVKLVPVVWQVKLTPAVPAFADADAVAGGKKEDGAATLTYRINVREFDVRVKRPADAQALLLSVGDRPPLAIRVDAKTDPVVFARVSVPGDGNHVLTLAAANGKEVQPQKATLTVKVRTVGPQVASVSAPGFGGTTGRQTVMVQFRGEELDPATAVAGNFTLRFRTGTAAGDVKDLTPIENAVYDKAANTVTLAYTGIVPGSYTLTVKGGTGAVADVFGNLLVLPSGVTGTNFTYDLTAAGEAAALPSQSAGVTFQTGPNVAFPEYVPFRKVPEGFNPSDRVETRVVRLYYNRDAHRVAQIVNRDVKSYNAATVDVRRRAADRARDEANLATDERRALERAAVRAFEASRAAETQLAQAEQRDGTARTQAARARQLLTQRQIDLQQAQTALDRALADPRNRTQADAQVDAQRRTVAALEREVTDLTPPFNDATTEATTAAGEVATAKSAAETARKAYRDAVLRRDVAAAPTPNQPAPAALQTTVAEKTVELQAAAEELRLMQRRQIDARTELARARTELTNRQTLLDQANRDLARALEQAKASGANDAFADGLRQQVALLQAEVLTLQRVISSAETTDQTTSAGIVNAQAKVQALRQEEAKANEAALVKEAKETRLKQEQFRREVAAAREDPDTYAPGKPESVDPVQQCSISVVGEGLIQIRGPIKGLNVIRLMINQLDAPVGQVKVGVHTVQVNGEHGDRMEKVVANIQRYIDHSRFLTAQSSQMLRKAITLVAARKAEEAHAQLGPACTQADRDLKYLHAFYGRDFVAELHELDSEFLRTGNKLLSLNSMDSTSLAAALFQMSLAKNSIRAEIVREFQGLLAANLPQAEQSYYLAGLSGNKCEACCDKKHYCLAYNARFQSFIGFFDAEIPGDDTLTPLQREFIRLAQIFKARLITELQLKQRVMERSLLEERVGTNYLEELRRAKALEDYATEEFDKVQRLVAAERGKMFAPLNELGQVFGPIQASIREFELVGAVIIGFQRRPVSGAAEPPRNLEELGKREADFFAEAHADAVTAPELKAQWDRPGLSDTQKAALFKQVVTRRLSSSQNKVDVLTGLGVPPEWMDGNAVREAFRAKYLAGLGRLNDLIASLDQFRFVERKAEYDLIKENLAVLNVPENRTAEMIPAMIERYMLTYDAARAIASDVRSDYDKLNAVGAPLFAGLADQDVQVRVIADQWTVLRSHLVRRLDFISNGVLRSNLTANIDSVDAALRKLQQAEFNSQVARRAAEKARRPLDEKKLLDLLVDEMEDKLIEQLEGTRAHTANIDNYIKSLSTALEDDFNTQFYGPAFRKIREASRYWDVTLGQVETTTVLANNRAFAKVDPAATFEFDLPKRNIMITEGFQAAKALMDEYGALLTDPTFLALTKLYSGQPLTAQHGTGGGLSPVRNVLPGLPATSDELIMAQAGPGRKEFGSALEALIPDPAIYKFETGTGYEIRPVLSPDGQAMVFNFNYMYTTDVREPVRPGEKHLGRVKRHFIHTDVQLSNYELREVSTYRVGLKAARTAKGVPLLQDIPGVGLLFRPLPSAESALQENLIYAQGTIFPTLFDLMGLRYAPAVADLDPLAERNEEWVVRARRRDIEQRIYDYGAAEVDRALRIPTWEQRPDLYRPQVTIPHVHPNGYYGPGLKLKDSHLREGTLDPYDVRRSFPETRFAPGSTTQIPAPPDPRIGLPPGVPAGAIPTGPPGGYLPPPTVQTIPGPTVIVPGGPPPGVTPLPIGMPRPVTPSPVTPTLPRQP